MTYDGALDHPGPVHVLCDGRVVATVENGDAAWEWILKHQGQSVSWALDHGYAVEPAEADD